MTYDVIDKHVSKHRRCVCFPARNEVHHFGKTIDKHEETVKSI